MNAPLDPARRGFVAMLDRYLARHPAEAATVHRMRALVSARPDCFERTCRPGHVTASAWVVSPDRTRFLLTHHRKLGRWLQLGGHADGDPDPLAVARREVEEESGLLGLEALGEPAGGAVQPFDLDVHTIPARGAEAAHEHHDVRYLLVARDDAVRVSDESLALRWFPFADLGRVATEESLHRLGRKALALLAR